MDSYTLKDTNSWKGISNRVTNVELHTGPETRNLIDWKNSSNMMFLGLSSGPTETQ